MIVGSPGEELQPGTWSSDGRRVLLQRVDQFVILRVADGSVARTGFGFAPIWVDDGRVDFLRDNGGRSELVTLDLSNGLSNVFGMPTGTSTLVGRGALDLAATTVAAALVTTIVDPIDGRIIATLPDVRAVAWARPGTLILKTVERDPARGAIGFRPGELEAWSAGDGLRSIATGLIDVRDVIDPSPSGDAFLCVCRRAQAARQEPDGIYRVSVDGSRAERLADVTPRPNVDPVPSWLSESIAVFLDGSGLHRLELGANAETLDGLGLGELPQPGYTGRAYALSGRVVVSVQVGSGPTGQGRLTARGQRGEIEFSQTFPAWNGVGLVVDPSHDQALVVSDPQLPNASPNRFYVLRAP